MLWLLWRSNGTDSVVMPASLIATVLREHKQLVCLGLESRLNIIENSSSKNFFLQSAEWQDAAAVCVSWLTLTDTACHLDPFNRRGSRLMVKMQAWHAGTLGTHPFWGKEQAHRTGDCVSTFTSMFLYESDTWESLLCQFG